MTCLRFANITPARVFNSSGNNIFYTQGNVGIGKASPSSALDVSGNVAIIGNVNIDSGALFVNASNNRVGVNTTTPSTTLDVSGTVAVSGATTISGNLTVDTNTLFVDAASNRVGIGMNNPSVALDVNGTIATPSLQIQNVGTSTGTAFKILRGSVAQVTGTAQRTINFGYTFSTPPVLCINAVYVVSGQSYRFFASTEQVTTTSFTYTLLFTHANNSTVYSGGDQHTLNWIAIGV